jgi:hypothetical protein
MSRPTRGIELRQPKEILENAKDFLEQYFSSIKRLFI